MKRIGAWDSKNRTSRPLPRLGEPPARHGGQGWRRYVVNLLLVIVQLWELGARAYPKVAVVPDRTA